jgi:hypothetical protein
VTVTTVGYGDRFPVPNSGRIIDVVILTLGVGLFGTLTAFLANDFVQPGSEHADQPGARAALPDDLKVQMEEMTRLC